RAEGRGESAAAQGISSPIRFTKPSSPGPLGRAETLHLLLTVSTHRSLGNRLEPCRRDALAASLAGSIAAVFDPLQRRCEARNALGEPLARPELEVAPLCHLGDVPDIVDRLRVRARGLLVFVGGDAELPQFCGDVGKILLEPLARVFHLILPHRSKAYDVPIVEQGPGLAEAARARSDG